MPRVLWIQKLNWKNTGNVLEKLKQENVKLKLE